MKNDNSNIKTLFMTFLKIGVFTFGGGYAMIALLETEFCVRKNWLDKKEFLDMTAISESTPGPTAVNNVHTLHSESPFPNHQSASEAWLPVSHQRLEYAQTGNAQ